MKNTVSIILLFLIFVSLSNTAHAQVRYEDVVEKIHYTDGMSYNPTTGQTAVISKEIGPSNPSFKVFIYGDFSTTYTKRFFSETFDYLKNKYQDAKFIFRNAVFLESDNGILTASMINCLAAQNNFWENIQNLISMTDLNNPNFRNVEMNQFNDCIKNPYTKFGVNIEDNLAKYYGFNSIPTMIIQNTSKPQDYSVKITGAQSTDIFDRAFLESKEGDLTKKDLEEIKADVKSLKQNVEKIEKRQNFLEEQIDQIKQAIDTIIKNIQALFDRIKL